MRIRLITTVFEPFNKVYKGFNRKLFEYLLPPLGLAKIRRYQGQTAGDIIDLRFSLPFFRQWTVIIKESWMSHREYGFIDRGLRVPLGIRYWKHTHRVVARNNESVFIIDDIEFETSYRLADWLLYLPLYFMFYPRKFQYVKYFRRLKNKS